MSLTNTKSSLFKLEMLGRNSKEDVFGILLVRTVPGKACSPLVSDLIASVLRRRERIVKPGWWWCRRSAEAWHHRGSSLWAVWVLLIAGLCGASAWAQDEVPVITGSAGFAYTKEAGQTALQPILAPVVLIPFGSRFLIEANGELQGYIARSSPNGPYEASFFKGVGYLQLDFEVSSRLTIVVGRFITPFDIYGERVGPLWITNFQDDPFIYPIGTRTSGASQGGMIRGALVAHPNWLLNYTAFFSAASSASYFESGRAFGVRTGVFFPKERFEIGTSYERFLQDQNYDAYGAYISWQPPEAPLDVKAEYAHSPQGHGYWIQGGYRFQDSGGKLGSFLKNLQPIARGQQFFRTAPGVGDALPAADAQRVDFGLNYYLPHEVRVNATYGRQFSSLGNSNNWAVDITYRFLFPMPFWPKGSH
jgi:hypothetical protein